MVHRRPNRLLPWALLLIIGCSGGSNGNLGCGSGCIAPIPGGFPATEQQAEGASIKISEKGLRFIESQVATIVQQVGQQTGGLSFSLPCTQQTPQIITGVNAKITICDLDSNAQCTWYDDDTWNRWDTPVNKCFASAEVVGSKLLPTQQGNGTVTVKFQIQVRVRTGDIPITVGLSTPLGGACGLNCAAAFDSTVKMPEYVPISADIELTIDTQNGDILTYNIKGIDDITQGIDTSELQISNVSGQCSLPLIGNLTCSILNNDIVKNLVFQQLQTEVNDRIKDTIDGIRCVQCEAGTRRCPGASTCQSGLGVCYYDYAARHCPTVQLGLEGRANVGEPLASFGGNPDSRLDIYAVAGGQTAGGQPSLREQAGGIQIGMMGGAQAPFPSACVRPATWTPRSVPPQVNFDAEAAQSGPGTNLTNYQVGFALSDNFLDKALFGAWSAGTLCLNISSDAVPMLTSGLVSTVLPGINTVAHGKEVPMLLALRPTVAPDIRIGRGNLPSGPNDSGDALLTVNLRETDLDFYAFIEDRYARLFTVRLDLSLPLWLDFDPVAGTITPTLGDLNKSVANVLALNNEMRVASDADIISLIPALIQVASPALAGAIPPVSLPAIMDFQLNVLGARGTVDGAAGGGYQHMALFAEIALATAPQYARTETTASIVSSFVPKTPALTDPASQPKVVLDVQGRGIQSLNFPGYEYAVRVDGGFWSLWTQSQRIELAAPILRMQGKHNIEVRSRVIGQPGSVDLDPARVTFVVDYAGPTVKLSENAEAKTVETQAHDAVSADSELSYRYRVAGAEWTAWGEARTFAIADLGKTASLEAEVRDASGHVTAALYGMPADWIRTGGKPTTKATTASTSASAAGGCAQTGAQLGGLLGLAVMLARRRRS